MSTPTAALVAILSRARRTDSGGSTVEFRPDIVPRLYAGAPKHIWDMFAGSRSCTAPFPAAT